MFGLLIEQGVCHDKVDSEYRASRAASLELQLSMLCLQMTSFRKADLDILGIGAWESTNLEDIFGT